MKGSCFCDMEALQKHASTVYTEEEYCITCQPLEHWSIFHPHLYWMPFRKYVNVPCVGLTPLTYVISCGWRKKVHSLSMHLISLGARCSDWEYHHDDSEPPWIINVLVIRHEDMIVARKLIRCGILFDLDRALLSYPETRNIQVADRCRSIDRYRLTFHNNVKVLQLIKGIWDYARSPTSFNRLPKDIVAMIIKTACDIIIKSE